MGNIGTSADYVNQVRQNIIKPATTPELHRVTRRPVTEAAPTDVATISPGAINPQPLEFNPELPTFDNSQSPIQQLGGNGEIAFYLGVGLPGIRAAAKDVRAENQVLGGTASA